MANTIIALKKSAIPSAVPSDLANGELAINYADGKIFYKKSDGTISEISGGGGGGNSFGTVNANGVLIIADTSNDILTLEPGDNIIITGDAINDKITISAIVPDISPAFDKANSANVLAFNSAIGANAYATSVGTAGNTYATSVGTAGNNYTITVGAAANNWANTISEAKTVAGNAYTVAVGTAGNNYTITVGAAANTWANTVGIAANSYATSVGTAGNAYARTVGTASNTYADTVGTAGNSYTQTVGAAANTRADTKVSSVTGTTGRITSSGGTTPAIDLATAGAGANTYSTGISAITVDAYGRVTSVTGSAGYITSSGSITGSAGTFTSTTQDSRFNSLGIGTAASGTTGEVRATNNITAYYSDGRLKSNIKIIENALGKVMQISGITFTANEEAAKYGYGDTSVQVGVIAQEVEKVLPQIVVAAPFDIGKNDDGSEYSISGQNYKTVRYEKIVPLLIEAIKEQQQVIEQLQLDINMLKEQIKERK